ncbi:MAG TPA: hypothetical protein VGA24_10800 [Steroidobacteraceae bacterium]
MSQLNLTFVVDGGKTRTQIGLKKNVNKILFTNGALAGDLTVVFSPGGRIEKDGGGSLPGDTLTLLPGKSAFLKFKGNPGIGDKVNYTAQIVGANPEDPIIIID